MKGSTIRAMLSDARFSEGARMVLLAVASRANSEGRCFPSNRQISQDCGGMPGRTVRHHLATIVAAGVFSTQYDRAKHRRYITVDFAPYDAPEQGQPVAGAGRGKGLPQQGQSDAAGRGNPLPKQGQPTAKAGATRCREQGQPVAAHTMKGPLNGPMNEPKNPPQPPTGGAGGRGGLETVEQATDGEVQAPTLPPVKRYAPEDIAQVEAVADDLDPFQNGGWRTLARQRVGQYPPGWVIEALRAGYASNARHFRLVDTILARYEAQGGPDQPKRPRNPDAPPPGMKFSQIGQKPQKPWHPSQQDHLVFKVPEPGAKVGWM